MSFFFIAKHAHVQLYMRHKKVCYAFLLPLFYIPQAEIMQLNWYLCVKSLSRDSLPDFWHICVYFSVDEKRKSNSTPVILAEIAKEEGLYV